jgi:hypothetical protein
MSIVINGTGSISGLAVGGLPDGTVDSGTIATGTIVNADINASAAIVGTKLANTGKVLQVIQTHLTTTSSQSISTTRTNITGLSATITPSATTSRVRVTVKWSGENAGANENLVFGIKRNTTDVGNPAAAGSRHVGIAGIYQGYFNSDNSSTPDSTSYSYIDSPSSTSAITYYATVINGGSTTLYNQSTATDGTDNYARERLTSTITVEEIGA